MDEKERQQLKNLAKGEDLDLFKNVVDERMDVFEKELRKLINTHGMDNLFGIHDFVLSGYMVSSAKTLSAVVDAESSLRGYKKL